MKNMPISRATNIPTICEKIINIKPKTVLDVGCGFGMYGFLARIYGSIWNDNITIKEYQNWRNLMTVDGIEIYSKWITDLQKLIYNKIYIGDMRDLIKEVGNYDMILFPDSIEHLKKEDGLKVLKIAREKAKTVIISTPNYFYEGKSKGGNEWEKHLSVWPDEDFPDNPTFYYNNGQKIIVYE